MSFIQSVLYPLFPIVFEGKHSRLSVVYGAMSGGGVRALLIGCIVMSVILIVSGSTVHGILVRMGGWGGCDSVYVAVLLITLYVVSPEKETAKNW